MRRSLDWLLWFLTALLFLYLTGTVAKLCFSAELRVPAKCVSVYDGDTLTLRITTRVSVLGATISKSPIDKSPIDKAPVKDTEISFDVSVRLLDLTDIGKDFGVQGCWAPELYEPKGRVSRDSLKRMALGKEGVLIIDLDRAFSDRKSTAQVSRLLTLNRVFGDFFVPGFQANVARRQINSGYAWPTKVDQWNATYKRFLQ